MQKFDFIFYFIFGDLLTEVNLKKELTQENSSTCTGNVEKCLS